MSAHKFLTLVSAAFACLLTAPAAHAQVIFEENFGTASGIGAPLPAGTTTYTYNGSMSAVFPDILDDGQYTIASNAQQGFNSWADISDNTTGTGQMLLVNATEGVTDEFYRREISLTANTTFELAAYLISVNSVGDRDFCEANEGGLILPDVRFRIESTDGTVLASSDTGPIPFNETPQWEEYALTFTTPGTGGNVVLVLSNNAPGGCGNDIALDDITVRVPVTYIAVNDSGTAADGEAGQAFVLNVLDNDSDDGAPLPSFVLTASGLPLELTFDPNTGNVGVVAGTASGTYTFTYELCEAAVRYNCDTATVTIFVNNAAPPGSGSCPVGFTSVLEGGFGLDAIFANGDPAPLAEGAPAPEGANDTGQFSEVTYFSYIQIDLTGDPDVLVAGNTALVLSLTDAFNSGARGEIQVSQDGSTYQSLGTIGQGGTLNGSWDSNILRRDTITVPGTGIRYVRIDHQAGGVRVDAASFDEKCIITPPALPELEVTKTSSLASATGFLIPGDDVIYEITVSNNGAGAPDADTVFVVDTLPNALTFFNGDIDGAGNGASDPVQFIDGGAGVSFNYNSDVGYSAGATPPQDFSDCTYSPAAGYDENVRFICIQPQGTMSGGDGSTFWSIRFRARIR